jgi:hypothetical protein
MTSSDPVDIDIDQNQANAARMYDYYLGGDSNFAVDRQTAREALRLWPNLLDNIYANRSFLRRAVRFLADAGITQFLDIGSGIPTVGNVHEIALAADPAAHVVYVDIDPVAVSHSRSLLRGLDHVTAIRGDLRRPDEIVNDAEVRRLIDFDRPVAVLLFAVFHFIPDADDPAGIVARLRDSMAPGSYVALSHATFEGNEELAVEHEDLYARTASPMTMRSHDQVATLLDGFDLVEPGLVRMPAWRPDPEEQPVTDPDHIAGFAAVGRPRFAG